MSSKGSPYFSIILPCLNSESTISLTIKSIINQTFENFELIIVDGLSNDKTVSIIKSFKDDRIKVISETDKGIYDAMNKGISLAEGEWLYFIGGDDELFNDTILNSIYKEITPSCLFIFGNVKFQTNSQIYKGNCDFIKIRENNICQQSVFYHRSIFKVFNLFDLQYPIGADWAMNIRCFMMHRKKIKYTNCIIANYSNNGSSTLITDSNFLKKRNCIYIQSYLKSSLSFKIYSFIYLIKTFLKHD